ncbi:SIR2 family protein [Lacinutrix algicola]|uniref:SIR2 family protein n=1 Tax=Lacinutrix algicola TaxID=342954 RepID=UPI0006E26DEB|nr:SIR2 family protein [Lacinutrix algicola]
MNKKLIEAIENDSLVLFVGAGMSMPLKFPSWTKLIQNILEEIKDDGRFNFDYHFKQGDNINVFEALNELETYNYNSKAKRSLNKEIKSVNFDKSQLDKHKKLWDLSDKIFTTNYDKVLEKVKPDEVEAFSNGNKFQQSESLQGKPFLYKIHGDITDPDTCIFFDSDYKKLYEDDTPDLQTLKTFLTTKTILFVGFSLNDPYVVKQMEYIYSLYNGYNKEHYVIQKKQEDFSKYNVKSLPIENWDDSFDRLLDELISFKTKNISEKISIKVKDDKVDISKSEDLVFLQRLFDDKLIEYKKETDFNKKKISKEVAKIRNRILELQTLKLDLDFNLNIPIHKDEKLEHLFDLIYNSENLSSQVVADIQKVREQHSQNHQWYHRSVIVSALACSLINHKKLDPKKIDLLIDFTNDSEDKVWQKAITYLFFILNHLGNKWLRYSKSLTQKLERLKESNDIQEALKKIIGLMQFELQNASFLDKKIFENEYFKDTPFNYFLPFYKGNSSVDKLYENDNIEDIKDFVPFLFDLPMPDAAKYLMCNKKDLIIKKVKENVGIKGDEDIIGWSKKMRLYKVFEPYLSYVNEFLNFYENFPNIDSNFKQKVSLVSVKNLKNLLLNTVEHHRAMARQFSLQDEMGNAISHYEQLLKIEEEDISAMMNLATCYFNSNKDTDDSLKLRLRIKKVDPKNHKNLNEIGNLYEQKEDYKNALKHHNEAIELNQNKAEYYSDRASVKRVSEKYAEAIKDYNLAINLDNKESVYYNNRGVTKSKLDDFDGAIEDYNISLKIDDKSAVTYSNLANVYRRIDKLELSHEFIEKALKLDNKDGVIYGTKAAIYSTQGDNKQFYIFLEKAMTMDAKASWLDKDVKDSRKDEKDFKDLLLKYNQTLD